MTPRERNALMSLCERITQEQDPVEFQQLVVDLLDLLEHVARLKRKTIPNRINVGWRLRKREALAHKLITTQHGPYRLNKF